VAREPIIPREDTHKRAPRSQAPDDFGLPPDREAYYRDTEAREAEDEQEEADRRAAEEGRPSGTTIRRARSQASSARRRDAAGSRRPGRTGGRRSGPPRSRPPRVPSPGRPTLARPLGRNVPVGAGAGLSGLLLGAIAYALILSVVEFGAKGPGMWFKAKFLNEAGPAAPTGTAGAGGPIVPGPSNPGGIAAITPVPAPAGAPPGTYGVDQNGNLYRQGPAGWSLYQTPSGVTPAPPV
jgi:hypothetical protein